MIAGCDHHSGSSEVHKRKPTPTVTATSTAVETITATPSVTPTPSITQTATATVSATATSSATTTVSPTATTTRSATATATATRTATATATGSITPTATVTQTATVTATATTTGSPTSTASATPTATVTATSTTTGSVTPTATATGSATPTASGTSTATITPTATITATATGSPSPTITATPTASPTAIACPSGSAFTIENNNSYPIWLAESYQGSSNTIVAPPGNDWEMERDSSVSLCMPASWNGRFWPRTECNFGLFDNDPGYQSCTTTADCTVNNIPPHSHICYGGKCMLTCNTGSTIFCTGSSGLNNSSAICAPVSSSTAAPAPQVCTYPQGTVCKTGDCLGLYQCYGTWGQNTALQTAGAPVSLFEASFTGTTAVNYDVSLVNGYNTQIDVQPSIPASGATCYQPSCTSDLNASCPANLQFTEAPTSTVSLIPCGGGYCQSGACVNSQCTIACWAPGDLCGNSPPANLMCNSTLPSGATYIDMYLVKDDRTTGPTPGVAMSSGNQGDSTCWADVDCPPDQTCEMAGEAGLPVDFPTGVGVCSTGGVFNGQINCMTQSDVGNSCGGYQGAGYPGAIGYTCLSTGMGTNDVACVPKYNPPVSGLGTGVTNGTVELLTGVGSFINPDWLTAMTQAGGGTPYYETYAGACPHQYGFSYDDIAGDLQCFSAGPNINFVLIFGP